jgi:hypothetical protein
MVRRIALPDLVDIVAPVLVVGFVVLVASAAVMQGGIPENEPTTVATIEAEEPDEEFEEIEEDLLQNATRDADDDDED